jgi:lactoylglutathione lyase
MLGSWSLVMKLNHLNLTVTSVPDAHAFLEKYFGLRSMGGGSEQMAGLFDDNGLSLVLMTAGRSREVAYPASFHLGFMQESEEQVNAINQRLKDDGFAVPPPRRLHGMWTFYFEAPGGFTIEVGR